MQSERCVVCLGSWLWLGRGRHDDFRDGEAVDKLKHRLQTDIHAATVTEYVPAQREGWYWPSLLHVPQVLYLHVHRARHVFLLQCALLHAKIFNHAHARPLGRSSCNPPLRRL